MPSDNGAVVLSRRPIGSLSADDISLVDAPFPDTPEDGFVVENLFASLDPGVRNLLGADESYITPVAIGEAVTATTVGRVSSSRNPNYSIGDFVVGTHDLKLYSAARPGPMTWTLAPDDPLPLQNHLSAMGAVGLTAYFGVLHVGRPVAGETVLISSAAGAVGSIAGQIARLSGCRVVGIAGGPQKCARLIEEFGFNAAVDYRGKQVQELTEAIRLAAPEGIDFYFDNVGGTTLDAALGCMNFAGRVALCGLISQYEGELPTMRNLFRIVARTLRLEGFLVFTYRDEFPGALAQMRQWIENGDLRFREHIEVGIDRAIPGFLRLFTGSNDGKMLVDLRRDHETT